MVELWLNAGFKDLEIVNRFYDQMPLLHACIARRITLTPAILRHLTGQIDMVWRGFTALEYGDNFTKTHKVLKFEILRLPYSNAYGPSCFL